MIAYAYFSILLSLLTIYALFLERIRQGLEILLLRHQPIAEEFIANTGGAANVSVIVPARNEVKHISRLIDSLKAQSYEQASVQFIIVDDHSTDGTAEKILQEAGRDPRFFLLRLDGSGSSGKKQAIAAAVAIASGDIILTTDADCIHHEDWVRAMVHLFRRDVDLVAGPVMYPPGARLFARLQSLEFLGLMGVGAGFFGVGYPRLCNGANLAYRKELFREAGAIRSDDPIASGDDEFLMHSIVYRLGRPADFVSLPESVVLTAPAPSVRAFFSQRARWASKGAYYEDKRFVAFLVLLFFYFVLLTMAPFAVANSPYAILLFLLLYFFKMALDIRVLRRTATLLNAPIRFYDWILAEFVHPPYLVIATLAGTFWKGTWKDRSVRANSMK